MQCRDSLTASRGLAVQLLGVHTSPDQRPPSKYPPPRQLVLDPAAASVALTMRRSGQPQLMQDAPVPVVRYARCKMSNAFRQSRRVRVWFFSCALIASIGIASIAILRTQSDDPARVEPGGAVKSSAQSDTGSPPSRLVERPIVGWVTVMSVDRRDSIGCIRVRIENRADSPVVRYSAIDDTPSVAIEERADGRWELRTRCGFGLKWADLQPGQYHEFDVEMYLGREVEAVRAILTLSDAGTEDIFYWTSSDFEIVP